MVLVILLSLEQLGVQATSLLAILGAAGLAIGLALQGTLSNIAAGLMLLWLRPFRVGDFIEVPTIVGLSGKVREIGLFTCTLDTSDGLFLFVPNSAIWNAPLRNYTHNSARLLALSLTFSSRADRKKLQEVLLDIARKEDAVLKQPEPVAIIESSAAESTTLTLACWTLPTHITTTQKSLMERIESGLAPLGPTFAPAKVARFLPADTDPSRFLMI
jgi:small conductance mechanosensitive channel